MSVVVTGSIAIDCLMRFPGRFTERFADGGRTPASLSFLADHMDVRYGGVAANIAYGLSQLGVSPKIVGAVGTDFGRYREWLDVHGVDTTQVHVSATAPTACFVCTTDTEHNRIGVFHAGAMAEGHVIELGPQPGAHARAELVFIAPDDKRTMLRYAQECRRQDQVFAADPSQQLASMDGRELRAFIDGAAWLFTNEEESEALLRTADWSPEEVLRRVGFWVITLGGRGVRIHSFDRGALVSLEVPAVATHVVERTGAGDAFRAGFIAGVISRLDVERAAQLGCATASLALEGTGAQGYTVSLSALLSRMGSAYGRSVEIELATQIRRVVRPPHSSL